MCVAGQGPATPRAERGRTRRGGPAGRSSLAFAAPRVVPAAPCRGAVGLRFLLFPFRRNVPGGGALMGPGPEVGARRGTRGQGGTAGSATDRTFSSFFFLLCRDPARKREGERMAQLRTASWARVPWMTSSTCPPNSASRPVPGPPGRPVLPPTPHPPVPTGTPCPPVPAPTCAQRLPRAPPSPCSDPRVERGAGGERRVRCAAPPARGASGEGGTSQGHGGGIRAPSWWGGFGVG